MEWRYEKPLPEGEERKEGEWGWCREILSAPTLSLEERKKKFAGVWKRPVFESESFRPLAPARANMWPKLTRQTRPFQSFHGNRWIRSRPEAEMGGRNFLSDAGSARGISSTFNFSVAS